MALASFVGLAASGYSARAQAHEASYRELLARVRAGEKGFDFLALRRAYADDADYDPYGSKITPLVREMNAASQGSDCPQALAIAKKIIALNFIYIDAHFRSAICERFLGHAEAAERETVIARGLYRSIIQDRDGKTPATAFDVVMLPEEYEVLRGLGLTKKDQSLIDANGHSYDRLGAVAKSGEATALFFNVDRLFAGLARQRSPKQ